MRSKGIRRLSSYRLYIGVGWMKRQGRVGRGGGEEEHPLLECSYTRGTCNLWRLKLLVTCCCFNGRRRYRRRPSQQNFPQSRLSRDARERNSRTWNNFGIGEGCSGSGKIGRSEVQSVQVYGRSNNVAITFQTSWSPRNIDASMFFIFIVVASSFVVNSCLIDSNFFFFF